MEPHKKMGGGSGGGDGNLAGYIETQEGGELDIYGQFIGITANGAQVGEDTSDPPAVMIVADSTGDDGMVEINGSQGVRITAGPPSLPPVDSESTNGVEIVTGETQNVTLQRGLIQGVDQMIQMTPSGITVDAGTMPVTIQSLTQITLSVAGGVSTITIAPEGITIQGVLVQIN